MPDTSAPIGTAAPPSGDEMVGPGAVLAAVGALVVVVVAFVAVLVMTSTDDEDPTVEPQTVSFVVAAGTGARLDAGEVVEIMPAEVRLAIGDTLEIRNEDSRNHVVGPYFVRAGETLSQTYTRAQELTGDCELGGEDGVLRVIVA